MGAKQCRMDARVARKLRKSGGNQQPVSLRVATADGYRGVHDEAHNRPLLVTAKGRGAAMSIGERRWPALTAPARCLASTSASRCGTTCRTCASSCPPQEQGARQCLALSPASSIAMPFWSSRALPTRAAHRGPSPATRAFTSRERGDDGRRGRRAADPAGVDPRCWELRPGPGPRGIIAAAGFVRSERPSRNASPVQQWRLSARARGAVAGGPSPNDTGPRIAPAWPEGRSDSPSPLIYRMEAKSDDWKELRDLLRHAALNDWGADGRPFTGATQGKRFLRPHEAVLKAIAEYGQGLPFAAHAPKDTSIPKRRSAVIQCYRPRTCWRSTRNAPAGPQKKLLHDPPAQVAAAGPRRAAALMRMPKRHGRKPTRTGGSHAPRWRGPRATEQNPRATVAQATRHRGAITSDVESTSEELIERRQTSGRRRREIFL